MSAAITAANRRSTRSLGKQTPWTEKIYPCLRKHGPRPVRHCL